MAPPAAGVADASSVRAGTWFHNDSNDSPLQAQQRMEEMGGGEVEREGADSVDNQFVETCLVKSYAERLFSTLIELHYSFFFILFCLFSLPPPPAPLTRREPVHHVPGVAIWQDAGPRRADLKDWLKIHLEGGTGGEGAADKPDSSWLGVHEWPPDKSCFPPSQKRC